MASSPRDTNRIPAILVQDTVSSKASSASGILVGSVEAQAMALVDGSGNQIVSFGGGQQYTDGSAGVAHPIGTAIIFQGGSNVPNVVSASQPLPVTLTSTTITGTVAATQSGTWTVGLSAAQTLATVTTVGAVTGITNALPAGTNLMGKVGIDQTTPGTTNAIANVPSTITGWSFNYQSALSSTKAQLKGTAGAFGGYINLYNPNTAVTFIQVFNKASASVTVGTTAPDFVITLPGLATASGTGTDRNLEITCGVLMSTGITVAATTTATGSSAPANAIVGTFLFI